jgi:hypothetical protein
VAVEDAAATVRAATAVVGDAEVVVVEDTSRRSGLRKRISLI